MTFAGAENSELALFGKLPYQKDIVLLKVLSSMGKNCIALRNKRDCSVNLLLACLIFGIILSGSVRAEVTVTPVATIVEDVDENYASVSTAWQGEKDILSPGDKLQISITGQGGEIFSGDYDINQNSALDLPHLPPVSVENLTRDEIEEALAAVLLDKKMLKPGLFSIDVQVLEYSSINVTVRGAVFQPGRVVINTEDSSASGGSALIAGDRDLTSALFAAGGVTPFADVREIEVTRTSGEVISVDLSGLFRGFAVNDIPLMAGDIVTVRSAGVFQPEIVRPSPITPSEVSTFVSNVTQPISSRNTLETSDRSINVTLFTYGTRLSQAVVAAQCAGGAMTSNAGRKVLFNHTDEATGEVFVVDRWANSLITKNAESSDVSQDVNNPFLMPQDSIICYDSAVVNIREIFQTLATILIPFNLWDNIK